MTDKDVVMTSDEVLDYIRENVEEFDKLEISYNRVFAGGDVLGYNRVFAGGDVLGLDFSEYNGVPGFKIMISLDGKVINDAVEIDLIKFKEDIIEVTHYPQDEEKESVYIEVM